uniref:Uncharacterized protein n=1 Tax=Myotis myotis TaxID=51298 RepID=A0A7J7R1X2_MYOMY|nr:hypothetical protein mMyoMyo1_011203 [Myotis myotis]
MWEVLPECVNTWIKDQTTLYPLNQTGFGCSYFLFFLGHASRIKIKNSEICFCRAVSLNLFLILKGQQPSLKQGHRNNDSWMLKPLIPGVNSSPNPAWKSKDYSVNFGTTNIRNLSASGLPSVLYNMLCQGSPTVGKSGFSEVQGGKNKQNTSVSLS